MNPKIKIFIKIKKKAMKILFIISQKYVKFAYEFVFGESL